MYTTPLATLDKRSRASSRRKLCSETSDVFRMIAIAFSPFLPWYDGHCLGYGYRLTQLMRLDEWVARRRALVDVYDEQLRDLPLVPPQRSAGSRSALYLYVMQIGRIRTRIGRKAAFEQLRARGIGVNVHYIPVHTQSDCWRLGFRPNKFRNCEFYYSRSLSLSMHAGLTDVDQESVIEAFHAVLA